MASESFNPVTWKRLEVYWGVPRKLWECFGGKCYGGNYWDPIIGKNAYWYSPER